MGTMRATAADGEDTIAQYRWVPLAVGTALGVLVVTVLDGAIAGMAQRSDRLWYASVGAPWSPYSLSRHVLAMAALALLTVAVATALTRCGAGLLGGLMVLGVVAGPMAVCGAPVSRSLLDDSLAPYWWWSLLVGAVHVAVLEAWTWWTTAALRHLDLSPNPALANRSRPGRRPAACVARGAMFVTVAAAVLAAEAMVGRGQVQEDLGVVAMLGWALLAGGLAATVAASTRRWAAPTTFAAAVGVLTLMSAAYARDGGWPGVAGWEPITSPYVLSWTSTVAVCAAPLAGGAWQWLRAGHPTLGRGRSGVSPAT